MDEKHGSSEELVPFEDVRWERKYYTKCADGGPKKIVPSRFSITKDGQKVVLCYHSVVIESPKSLVCRYHNRNYPKNGFDKTVIVKYQLKFQNFTWCPKVTHNIIKRYHNPDRGDYLISKLPPSDRLCKYYGTYCAPCTIPSDILKGSQELTKQRALCSSAKGLEEPFIMQIFEELRGKDLYSFLSGWKNERNSLSVLLDLADDIAAGMSDMHDHGVYHGDMKPENIMIVKQNDRLRAVIIDFDFASRVTQDRLKRGTPRYLSPEYVQAYRGHHNLPVLGKIGREFDMWAIGAIYWAMFFGTKYKFYVTSYSSEDLKSEYLTSRTVQLLCCKTEYQSRLIRKLFRLNKRNAPEQVMTLIKNLLSYSPGDRPTARETQVSINRIKEMGNYDTHES